MNTVTPSRTTSFCYFAARLSWVCPIITIITFASLIIGGEIIPRRTIAVIASSGLCLLLIGLILAIAALLGVPRQGTRGILAPAIVGIIINGLLLFLAVAWSVGSRARRPYQHGSIAVPAVRVVWSDSRVDPKPSTCPAVLDLLIGPRACLSTSSPDGRSLAGVVGRMNVLTETPLQSHYERRLSTTPGGLHVGKSPG